MNYILSSRAQYTFLQAYVESLGVYKNDVQVDSRTRRPDQVGPSRDSRRRERSVTRGSQSASEEPQRQEAASSHGDWYDHGSYNWHGYGSYNRGGGGWGGWNNRGWDRGGGWY